MRKFFQVFKTCLLFDLQLSKTSKESNPNIPKPIMSTLRVSYESRVISTHNIAANQLVFVEEQAPGKRKYADVFAELFAEQFVYLRNPNEDIRPCFF